VVRHNLRRVLKIELVSFGCACHDFDSLRLELGGAQGLIILGFRVFSRKNGGTTVAGAALAILRRSELWRTGGYGGQGGEMADAQDLKIHFWLFQMITRHHSPSA
jgi:hypothetical protein